MSGDPRGPAVLAFRQVRAGSPGATISRTRSVAALAQPKQGCSLPTLPFPSPGDGPTWPSLHHGSGVLGHPWRRSWGIRSKEAPLATGPWPLPGHLLPVETYFLGLVSALRVLTAALQAGATDAHRQPGGVDTDYMKAKARPQLWVAASRCHTQSGTGRPEPAARRPWPGEELDDADRGQRSMGVPHKQVRLG